MPDSLDTGQFQCFHGPVHRPEAGLRQSAAAHKGKHFAAAVEAFRGHDPLALMVDRPDEVSDLVGHDRVFRQEKALDTRELPAVAALGAKARRNESAPPLTITKLSDVHGVNALVTGSVIELHAGLTILYGENGTGKTGYSQIFKLLADSRTADEMEPEAGGLNDGAHEAAGDAGC